MTYDHQILRILNEVGKQGISVRQLSKHIYNLNCSFFSQATFQDVHAYVQQYLLKNSRSPSPIVIRMEKRGYYCLNTEISNYVRQLALDFSTEDTPDEPCQTVHTDLSLDLFA